MPKSKTKQVKTPQYRESVLSAAIRDTVGDGQFGPAWANQAPQGKITKMRKYPQRSNAAKKEDKQAFAHGGPVLNAKPKSYRK